MNVRFTWVLFFVAAVLTPPAQANALSRAFQPLLNLFDGMPEGAYPRFMLFLLVFAVFLLLTRYAPLPAAIGDSRDDKRGRFLLGFIAAILAFISVIAIPDQYITFLYYEFSFFVAFILTLVPIAALLFLYTRAIRNVENVWARRIILTIVFLIIFSLLTGAAAQAQGSALDDQNIFGFGFSEIMEFLASISVILFIAALLIVGGTSAGAGYAAARNNLHGEDRSIVDRIDHEIAKESQRGEEEEDITRIIEGQTDHLRREELMELTELEHLIPTLRYLDEQFSAELRRIRGGGSP